MSQKEQEIAYPRFVWRRRILKVMTQVALAILTKVKIEGRDNNPEEGGIIVATNYCHFDNWAIFLVGLGLLSRVTELRETAVKPT